MPPKNGDSWALRATLGFDVPGHSPSRAPAERFTTWVRARRPLPAAPRDDAGADAEVMPTHADTASPR